MKQKIKQVIQQFGWEIKRRSPTIEDYLKAYATWQGIPWDKGYNGAKFGFIHQTINDPKIMDLFRKQEQLPEQFGIGFDERCVEYPWALSHLSQNSTKLLDAGSVLNFEIILENEIFIEKRLHIMTLAPEKTVFGAKEYLIFMEICERYLLKIIIMIALFAFQL